MMLPFIGPPTGLSRKVRRASESELLSVLSQETGVMMDFKAELCIYFFVCIISTIMEKRNRTSAVLSPLQI